MQKLGVPIRFGRHRGMGHFAKKEKKGTKRKYFKRAKICGNDNNTGALAENHAMARTYSIRCQMIRVDTLRSVVIIAIGGKIGNSSPSCVDLATGTKGVWRKTTHQVYHVTPWFQGTSSDRG